MRVPGGKMSTKILIVGLVVFALVSVGIFAYIHYIVPTPKGFQVSNTVTISGLDRFDSGYPVNAVRAFTTNNQGTEVFASNYQSNIPQNDIGQTTALISYEFVLASEKSGYSYVTLNLSNIPLINGTNLVESPSIQVGSQIYGSSAHVTMNFNTPVLIKVSFVLTAQGVANLYGNSVSHLEYYDIFGNGQQLVQINIVAMGD